LRKDLRKGEKDHEDRPVVQGLSARAAFAPQLPRAPSATRCRSRSGRPARRWRSGPRGGSGRTERGPCVFLARRTTKPSPQEKCVERKGQRRAFHRSARPADARKACHARPYQPRQIKLCRVFLFPNKHFGSSQKVHFQIHFEGERYSMVKGIMQVENDSTRNFATLGPSKLWPTLKPGIYLSPLTSKTHAGSSKQCF